MLNDSPSSLDVFSDSTGASPDISNSLKSESRVVQSVSQAYSICESLVSDWKNGILHAARITAKLNGERPYNQKKLQNAAKDWKTNISTGFLSTECSKVMPRLYMPIKTAKYLTAATLPPGWPNGEAKTQLFREAVTRTIRGWEKYNFWIRGLAREVGIFGFGFNVWPDQYDWRPNLVRMDKGFVPQGTEVMDTEPAFFMYKYDYKPSELLDLLKTAVDNGRTEWQKDNVVQAINGAIPPPTDSTIYNARTYEELTRQAVWQFSYRKGSKVIQTWHLFAKEATGKVSHYILLGDNAGVPNYTPQSASQGGDDARLLYKKEDKFDGMVDAVNTTVFDYGDGTVHGSWGAGQILYDLAAQVEKIRCDSIDNMRATNKIKAQVPEAKNVNDVKLLVTDTMMIVSGAQFSGNVAAMPQDIEGYERLDEKLTRVAQEKIGAFVPPIPLTPSDIKAAQVNAAIAKERELQEALLENWMIQFAVVVGTITKRLCDKSSPDDVSKAFLKSISEGGLTDVEIKILANQNPIQSVTDFTEYAASKRAAFAQSVIGNPLFRQNVAARLMAEGIGDLAFVTEIVKPDGDQQDEIAAQRDQLIENGAMASTGQPIPVLANDNDWVHMQTLKQPLIKLAGAGKLAMAQIALQHYSAHYAQGTAKKTLPKDQINNEKAFIAAVEKNLQEVQSQQAIQQHSQQITQQADEQAQQMIADGHPHAQ